jgi:hypothetical protein
MVAAGIPVIADRMVANAHGEVPGVEYVASNVGGWARSIRETLRRPAVGLFRGQPEWLESSKMIFNDELSKCIEGQ